MRLNSRVHASKSLYIYTYVYYRQWRAFVLHRNHWLKNQIDEMIVVCAIKDI